MDGMVGRIGGLSALIVLSAAAQEDTLDRKIAEVAPKPEEEKWLKIRWATDLLWARRRANENGKPLFLWLMDGDPLGCT